MCSWSLTEKGAELRMKKLVMPAVLVLFLILAQVANGATPVQDPDNGETHLYEVINIMMGTSFGSSQDPGLEALQVGNDDWWHEWDGYVSIVATYAGNDQNLYWENVTSKLIVSAALDRVHFYDDIENPKITFQTTGGDFWFKDMTSSGTWYSREDKNTPNEVHMVTYSFGNGVFICAFEDLSGLGDQDYNDLVFKIAYGAAPVNVPAISYIPDQAVSGGYPFPTINLNDYVRPEVASDLTWSTSAGTNISVSIDPNTRIATITYPPGWTGSETITFTATDPDGHFDTEEVTFTVNPPDAPVVADIPDQAVRSGESFSPIHLDDYVSHPAPNIGDEDIEWTTSGEANISVSIDPNTRIATITYPNGWIGSETITFIAMVNPSSSNPATFTVLSAGYGGGGVGGVALAVDKFGLVAPWMALIMFMTGIVVSLVIWRKR